MKHLGISRGGHHCLPYCFPSFLVFGSSDAGEQQVHHPAPAERVAERIRPQDDPEKDPDKEQEPGPDSPVVPPADTNGGFPVQRVRPGPVLFRGRRRHIAGVGLLGHLRRENVLYHLVMHPVLRGMSVTVIVTLVVTTTMTAHGNLPFLLG